MNDYIRAAKEWEGVVGTVELLCKRFGTSLLDPQRDEKILQGWQRLTDREAAYFKELDQYRIGRHE